MVRGSALEVAGLLVLAAACGAHPPEAWRIHGVSRGHLMAHAPRSGVPAGLAAGAEVLLYEEREGELGLLGLGRVGGLTPRPSTLLLEIEVATMRLPVGPPPAGRRWYASVAQLGPDLLAWSDAERAAFRARRLWEGMPEAALLAIVGDPLEVDGPPERRVVRPAYAGVERVLVEHGRVTRILPRWKP